VLVRRVDDFLIPHRLPCCTTAVARRRDGAETIAKGKNAPEVATEPARTGLADVAALALGRFHHRELDCTTRLI
jgi:hypothetical protein